MQNDNVKTAGRRLFIIALAIGLMSAAAGISIGSIVSAQRPPPMDSLLLLPEPRVLADFELLDGQGQPFSLERLRGRWSLLFFGFTNCPDVCPSALYDLARMNAQLSPQGGNGEAAQRVVFVSVDPERDTPEKLSQYVAYYDPEFIGATGSHAQLAALTAQLGIAYQIEEHDPGAENYQVAHSSSVVLVDPRGQLRGAFSAPLDADRMARDLATLMARED